MAGATSERATTSTPDFLAYLRKSPVTRDLAEALSYVIERRHSVAHLEERRAS